MRVPRPTAHPDPLACIPLHLSCAICKHLLDIGGTVGYCDPRGVMNISYRGWRRCAKRKFLTTGMYVPDYVVTNDLLAQAMDTSDEWITQRTGIKERRMVSDTYKMLQQLARAPDKEAYLQTLYTSGVDGKHRRRNEAQPTWPWRRRKTP